MRPLFHTILICCCFSFLSFHISAQEVRIRDVQLNDICYAPVRDRIYGAVPGNLPNGNSIAVIHPLTGIVEQYIPMGSEPVTVQVSDNGQYLYVALHGAPLLQRYNLNNSSLDPAIDLDVYIDPPYDNHYPIHGGELQVLPGNGQSVVVAKRDVNTTPGFSGISIFDNTTERPNSAPILVKGGDHIVTTPDGQTLWGLRHEYAPTAFTRYQMDAQGITETGDYPGLISGEAKHVTYRNGRIYLQNGQVFDVSGTGAPVLLHTVYFGQDFGFSYAPMVPAIDANVFYAVSSFNQADPFVFSGYSIRTFDYNTFATVASFPLPGDFRDMPKKLISTGQGRLALLAVDGLKTRLLLYRSDACTPQQLGLQISANKTIACIGDTITLEATPGYNEYYWSNGATGQSIKLSSQLPAYDSIRCRVNAPNGCLSAYSPSLQYAIQPPLYPPYLSITGIDNILCPDESAQIYAYSGNATAYVFNTGDTIPAGQQLTVSTPGLYTAYAIGDVVCPSEPTSVELFPAIANPGPAPQIAANGPLTTCVYEPVTLSAPAGAYGYYWSTGETTRSIRPQFGFNTPFSVQTVFENGCHSQWSDTVYVTIHPAPSEPAITEAFFELSIENITSFVDSIQWYRNGQAVAGAHSDDFSPTQPGIYTVRRFYEGCPSPVSLPYAFNGTCTAQITAQPSGFPVTQYTLIGAGLPTNNYTYLWSNASTATYITVNTPGEYCLTVTRPVDGATASACISVVPNDQIRTGAAYNNIPVAGMEVILLRFASGQFTAIDTLPTDVNGTAVFSGLTDGLYFAQAVPPVGSPLEDLYLPTYYYSNLFWNQVTAFTTGGLAIGGANAPVSAIQLKPAQQLTGSGTISGLVQAGSGFSFNGPTNETPLGGVNIFLLDQNGVPLAHMWSDANGQFSFSNLPYGVYFLYINLPGVTPIYATIVISPDTPNATPVTFTLMDGVFTVNVDETIAEVQFAWPNPATTQLYVALPEEATLLMLGQDGKPLRSIKVQAGVSTLSISDLPAGVYVLKAVFNKQKMMVQRVLKQ